MLVSVQAALVMGIEAFPVSVEVLVGPGNKYYIVGLPDAAIRESLQRIDSALKSNGLRMPRQKIVVNLSPADMRKEGSAYDLSMAAGILASSGQWDFGQLRDYLIMGELSLNGELRPIKGVLSLALFARKKGLKGMVIPALNKEEASLIPGLDIIGIQNISELCSIFPGKKDGFLNNPMSRSSLKANLEYEPKKDVVMNDFDFKEVRGQENLKRALEVAAAGGHNVLLMGPPGAGKTMLAQRLPSILPKLSFQEAIEVTQIHSVKERGEWHRGLFSERPFRAPHHSISDIALVGGGIDLQPGEISLAHNGVLFLDELPEFKRSALEVLRQPMENGQIRISRARYSVQYPANFMLIAAMNPCPCGNYNHPDKLCTCPPGLVQKYLARVSGPLLDRIDLHIQVSPVPFEDLQSGRNSEPSSEIRKRIGAAREIQLKRFQGSVNTIGSLSFSENISKTTPPSLYTNARMSKAWIQRFCALDIRSSTLLKNAMNNLKLSARAYDRILKVARTLADLEGKESICSGHIAEAIQFRSLDRSSWGGS